MEKLPHWLPYALAAIGTFWLVKKSRAAAAPPGLRAGMVWSELHGAYVSRDAMGRVTEYYA